MSLIKKADVKNHLSVRHRTGIHLVRPKSQSDATGLPQGQSSGADLKVSASLANPLTIPTPSEPDTALILASQSAKA